MMQFVFYSPRNLAGDPGCGKRMFLRLAQRQKREENEDVGLTIVICKLTSVTLLRAYLPDFCMFHAIAL